MADSTVQGVHGETSLQAEIEGLRARIESGEDPSRSYSAIVNIAVSLPGVRAAAIYLPQEFAEAAHQNTLAAHVGDRDVPEPDETTLEKETRRTVHGKVRKRRGGSGPHIEYLDIVCIGAPIGSLGVISDEPLTSASKAVLRELSYFVSIAFERQRLSSRLRHFTDRIEVLSQLNQLIAAGLGLDRIFKTLAREAAFRFGADSALAFMIASENAEELEVKGSYGCSPQVVPASLTLRNTFLGRALKMGGVVSVQDLRLQTDHGLDFLVELGMTSVHCCSLEVRGETLGTILLGYQSATSLSNYDGSMFEEFSQGAAVAIANARSQARLTSYTEKLEEIVQSRTADLAVQTARAEEASRAKSHFVANMSHELRTPLTAIVGYSSVLADGVYGPVTEKQREALHSIIRSSEHLKDLIDQVLNLSRIEAGKEDPQPAKVDLYPLMQQVFKLMLQTAVGKSVKLLPLETTPEIQSSTLWVDPRQIRQILINLMSNAVKYTPSGGSVSLSAEIIGDKARVSVKDTGVGISPEALSKLFKRFERGDNSYSQAQSGTGIGLSLTKHLTEINGGKIGVESEAGKGSTFWILVPLADANSLAPDSEDPEAVDESTATRLDGLNILVVDDNLMTCEVLKTILTKVGGNPIVAYTVSEAKKLSETVNLDAALIDLAIPGESGLALIEFFRKQCSEPLSTMPLIVVSACVFENDRQQAFNHGASYFIAKPFRPFEIVQTIRHLTTASVINSPATFRLTE